MQPARPLVASISRIPFFAGLDADALSRVAATLRTRRFRRGEVVFHAGDPGDALFLIMSGEIKISLPSETGDEAILASLRPGDVWPCSMARRAARRPPRSSPRRSSSSRGVRFASSSPPSQPSATCFSRRLPANFAG